MKTNSGDQSVLTAGTQIETTLLAKAESLSKRGRLKQAAQTFQQLLDRNPKHVDALTGLGAIALKNGKRDHAYKFLSRALSLAPTSSTVHLSIGDFYSAIQDRESAAQHYQQAVQLDPTDSTARLRMQAARNLVGAAQDPDYGRGTETPWQADDWIWEERSHQACLFVLFAGLGIDFSPPTFIFHNFLKAYPKIDKLFVRDLGKRWYLNGLGSLASNVDETAELIRKKSASYERTVFVGSSAGGMAAILYGELTGADKILAFAPQTVLTQAKEKEIGDHRWPRLMEQLRTSTSSPRFLDLQCMDPYTSTIDIHYAASCKVDQKHAERVTGNRVAHIPHENAQGHMIALHLRDNGSLRNIIEAEFT